MRSIFLLLFMKEACKANPGLTDVIPSGLMLLSLTGSTFTVTTCVQEYQETETSSGHFWHCFNPQFSLGLALGFNVLLINSFVDLCENAH